MKASRAAVRQVRALEKMASSMERIEGLLGWMITNLRESGALPELPYELQEPKVDSTDAPLEEKEESTESSSEDDEEKGSEAHQPEELEADSDESAVKPTEEVEVNLPVTKVG